MIRECWAENDGVRLHYLDNEGDGLPLLFVPGLHGDATLFREVLEAFAPRRALAASLRGRGQSAVPQVGYRLANHVGDIAAIADAAGLDRVCLVGHSVGVPYVISFALEYPRRTAALVLAGYPAHFPELTADWGMRIMMHYPDTMPMIAVLGLQHESAEVSLWESLADLRCPLMVMRGGKPTSRLSEELAEQYQHFVPAAHMVVFEDSGHRLWVPDLQRFVTTINDFLDTEASADE